MRYFFLDKKVTKKSSQQRGFFAARAFARQIRQNLGCIYFALFALPTTSAKTYYALQPHCPALFCLISPEAYLLTGKRLYILFAKPHPSPPLGRESHEAGLLLAMQFTSCKSYKSV